MIITIKESQKRDTIIKEVEIVDSNELSYLIGFIISIISFPLTLLICVPFIFENNLALYYYIIMLIIAIFLSALPLIALLCKYIFQPLYIVKYHISKVEIKCIYQYYDKRSFQICWSDVERLEVSKVKYLNFGKGNFKKRIGYSYRFVGPDKIATLRHYCFVLSKKKRDLFFYELKRFSEKLNKQFIIKSEIVKIKEKELYDQCGEFRMLG